MNVREALQNIEQMRKTYSNPRATGQDGDTFREAVALVAKTIHDLQKEIADHDKARGAETCDTVTAP